VPKTPPKLLTPPTPQTPPTLAARVRAAVPGLSWTEARELCRGGRVLVDGRESTDPAWRPPPGGQVEVLPAAAGTGRGAAAGAERGAATGAARGEAAAAARGAASLVVYADDDLVVVRKPAGVLTVPFVREDRDTLLALTRVALRRIEAGRARASAAAAPPPAAGAGAVRQQAPAGRGPTLRAVQRLDKDTSGLVVFARRVGAQRHLQRQLAAHTVVRRYEALVHGAARDAVYDSWIAADRGDGLRGSLAGLHPGPSGPSNRQPPPDARRAVTRVRVLAVLRGATHVACELETGRQHQIRIHLAEAGHPLVGETVYIRDYLAALAQHGMRPGSRRAVIDASRPMLHAAVLGFAHPRDGRPMLFTEPPPADFAALLERLRPRRKG
jgi:23S rRNA pseudouridine1911/1915/1917 synthase